MTNPDWKDGWPPVGWHGEAGFNNWADYCECVVLDERHYAVKGAAGWSVYDAKNALHSPKFRPLKSPREREIEKMVDALKGYKLYGDVHTLCETLYIAGARIVEK